MNELDPLFPPEDFLGPTAAGDAAALLPGYVLTFAVALAVALIVTPIMRRLAVKYGIIDVPDNERKVHTRPVPYLGGLGIFMGWIVGFAVSYFAIQQTDAAGEMMIAIILGAGAIVLTGFFDDIYGVSPRVKIGGMFIAAAALANQNIGIQFVENSLRMLDLLPGNEQVAGLLVYVLGTVALAAFVLGGCNAMNLIDGLDGLAGGVAAICCIGFAAIALLVASNPDIPGSVSNELRLAMCVAIVAALIGFLVYNFNPASIFMGDTGSLLLGYLCVSTMMLFSNTGNWALKLVTACLVVFGLPITDTLLAIIRRKSRGLPISSPDNEHIHHLMSRSGLSVKQTVLAMYALAALYAGVGVAMVAVDMRWRHMLIIAAVMFGSILLIAHKYGKRLALQQADAPAQPIESTPPATPQTPPAPDKPIDQPAS